MGLIKYEESTLINAKNKIDTYNDQILDVMRKVYNETNTISNILNTPKSNKNIADYLAYLDDRIKYVNNSRTNINGKIQMIQNEYRAYMTEISGTVGGNNGNG